MPKPQLDLQGQELDARRVQRVRTAELLRNGRTSLHVLAAAEEACTLAEKELARSWKSHPPPRLDCKEGCDWCCYLPAGTAPPEVFRIVAYLWERLPAEALEAVRERARAADEQNRARKLAGRPGPRAACPLLVEHRCCAYPVRPLTCRGFNSEDADRCEAFLQSRTVRVPAHEPQLRLHTFILDGLRAGLSEAGLKADLLDLTAALRIALDEPDAQERWLAGENMFAKAWLR
jgi:hypothetical protein